MYITHITGRSSGSSSTMASRGMRALTSAARGWGWMLLLALGACAAPGNPNYDRGKPHHTPDGFRNNYIEGLGNSGGSFR